MNFTRREKAETATAKAVHYILFKVPRTSAPYPSANDNIYDD